MDFKDLNSNCIKNFILIPVLSVLHLHPDMQKQEKQEKQDAFSPYAFLKLL